VSQTEAEEAVLSKQRSKKTQKKYDERKKDSKVDAALEDQFITGRVLGKLPLQFISPILQTCCRI